MSYYSTTITSQYYYLWSKYRPAILRLMIDSAEDPQEYKFSKHEFHNINPKEKGGHSFVLRVFEGKAINDIKTSIVAKDLLAVLQNSKTAVELFSTSIYEFTLDKQFVLHIKKEEVEVEEKEKEEVEEEEKKEEKKSS